MIQSRWNIPVVSVKAHTVTIMRDGIAGKISKERVIRALHHPNARRLANRKTQAHHTDCTTPEASSTATPRLTSSCQEAVLYPANKAVDIQRMPTTIEIPLISSRVTTEIDPNVVLDDADEYNTERTVNESQDCTNVSEERNNVPSTEDSDCADTVPSPRRSEPSDGNNDATEADVSANSNAGAIATDTTGTPSPTRSDPGSISKVQRLSRVRKTRVDGHTPMKHHGSLRSAQT